LLPSTQNSITKTPKLHILYIGLKNDYGNPALGRSFEYVNFFDTLNRSGNYKVDMFPFDEVMREVGREKMNTQLLQTIERIKPHCCFFVLFTDEIKKETIREITEKSGSITFNWFGDDHWRFNNYSRFWAPLFHWASTTDTISVGKYYKIGYRNIIKTQWGFNHHICHNYDVPKDHEVTFVGQVHSHRKRIIHRLKQKGVNIECWGKSWENGRLSQDEMVKIYSRSKINLNFTESSLAFRWKPIAKVFLNRRADDSICLNAPRVMIQNAMAIITQRRPQIKARNFEIPGSGGFLLTQGADNLEEYFTPDKEIAVFSGIDDLKDKIKYYLSHNKERENIRHAGYQRALRDHTFEKRFFEIFQTMQLLPES
jgi:spore maturation protein CgeB